MKNSKPSLSFAAIFGSLYANLNKFSKGVGKYSSPDKFK
jgi:hypothetical protein